MTGRPHATGSGRPRRPTRSSRAAARLRPLLTPEGLRLSEAGLAILADAGIEGDEAASAWRALWSYTFGFATFTLAGPSGGAPALAAVEPRLAAALADDDEFVRGLDLLLDGLEARAALRG